MATASPGNFGDEMAAAKARVERCPTTRKKLRATVARAAEAALEPKDRDDVPPWGVGAFLVALPVLAIVLMLLVAGCVPVEAVRQAELEAAVNHGHAGDETLPRESRLIGEKGERAWRAQHRALTGDDVPQAIREGWAPLEPELPR